MVFREVFPLICGSLPADLTCLGYVFILVQQFLWLYRSTVPAWSMQTGVAATHHAVLERMSTSAFASVVPTALLTRVFLVFPQLCPVLFLVVSRPPSFAPPR